MSKLTICETPDQFLALAGTLVTAVTGRIVTISEDGRPFVDYPGNRSGPVPSRTILSVSTAEEEEELRNADVLLLLLPSRQGLEPIIAGALRDKLARRPLRSSGRTSVERRVLIEAGEEITLKCGESSLRMTKDGRVVTRGKHLVSRSSGANKIKGASVQLN